MSTKDDLQWIILGGGKGSRLNPLSKDIPKCLLPIANRPLLSYQLEMLSNLHVEDVILITTDQIVDDIHFFLNEENAPVRVDIVTVPTYQGTAQSLLSIKDRIHKDFVVMSGDLIVEHSQLYPLLDMHRFEDSAVSILLFPNTGLSDKRKSKSNALKVIDYIGLDANMRLLSLVSSTDTNSNEVVTVKRSLLKRFPNMKIYSRLRDAHFYVFSNWTLDFLEKHESSIQSIKSDFIPLLLRAQYREKLVEGVEKPSYQYSSKNLATNLASGVKCFAHINYQGYCIRSNNLEHYKAANRDISSGNNTYAPREPVGERKKRLCNYISTTAQIDEKTKIPMGCVVGDGSVLGEGVGLKGSIIGKNCVIEKSTIINSIVMDNVVIKNGSRIQNCIICSNVTINDNASLENVNITTNAVLPSGTDLRDTNFS